MKIRFRLGLLLVAIVASLGLASPAVAQGGGGGTVLAPGCAQINSWTPGVTTLNSSSIVVLDVGVFNGCVDEGAGAGKMPAVSLTTTDTATGKWLGASTIMAGYGQWTYRFYLGAPTTTPPARTLTLTVTKPNGKVQDSRSATLAEVMQAALATQPAA